MTADIEIRQKFVELRAEGKSYDAIAKRIKVSKPTLLKWSKELKDQIEEVSKTIEEQFLVEQKIKRILRAEKISDELDEAYRALSRTDYKNITKKEMINVIEKLESNLITFTNFSESNRIKQLENKLKEKELKEERAREVRGFNPECLLKKKIEELEKELKEEKARKVPGFKAPPGYKRKQ